MGGKGLGVAAVAQGRGAESGSAVAGVSVTVTVSGAGSLKTEAGSTEPEFGLKWSEVKPRALGFVKSCP